MTTPAEYDLTVELAGDQAQTFIEEAVLGNTAAYELDKSSGILLKKYVDGGTEPQDMATYAMHHLNKHKKTNSVDDEMKLVFSDLAAEEIATSFIRSTSIEMRE